MKVNTSTTTFVEWVDWAKLIGIYLVVLGHGGLVNESVTQLIYSFHMPLFFVLSGYLYKYRSFADTLKRSWRSLIIPYLLINAVLLLVGAALYVVKSGTLPFAYLYSRLVPIFLGLGYNTDHFTPVCTPLWFVVALLIIQLLCSLSFKRSWRLLLIILSIVGSYWLSVLDIDTLIPLDSALMAMPFFVVGFEAKKLMDYNLAIYWMIPILLALYVVNSYNGRIDLNLCQYGNSICLMYLGGLLGTLFICQIARFFRGGVRLYVSGLLLVIGFNLTAIEIAKKAWMLLFSTMDHSSIIGVLLAICICILFYPCILFCKKYCKSILGYR